MIRLPANASIEALFAQAVSLHGAGQFDAAEQLYRALMERAPKQAAIPFNLGALLQRTGRSADAVEAFKKSLRIKPQMLSTIWASPCNPWNAKPRLPNASARPSL